MPPSPVTTRFLDVLHPHTPAEAVDRVHKNMDELACFPELRVSFWKRVRHRFRGYVGPKVRDASEWDTAIGVLEGVSSVLGILALVIPE